MLPNFAWDEHFQLHSHNLLEKLPGTKSPNTKQCPARLSPRIIPLYHPSEQACLFFWCCVVSSTKRGLSPIPSSLCGKPWIWSKSPTQQPKIYLFLPPEKCSLIKFTSSPIKSGICSSSNSNFYVTTLYKLYL